jgi:cytochrome c oxidase subunit 2
MPRPVRRKLIVLGCLALLGLALTHTALADDPAGITPRGPDSPQAAGIEDIYWVLLAIAGAIFVLVEGALILFVIRFRNRGRPRSLEGPQLHGATRLELIWTAAPVVILAAIVTFVLYKLPGINNVPSASAGNGRPTIRVEGRQFYWNFVYSNGVVQVQRLKVPVDRQVRLEIVSDDVDHSWWIPALQGKFDAIPGKTNKMTFKPEEVGTYRGQCGEFCGYSHPQMVATVDVVKSSEFDRWLAAEAQKQKNGTSTLGRQTFSGVCATCHGFKGEGGFGPTLQGNPVLGQPGAIRTLLLNGRGKMPAVGRDWSDTQMNALIGYLKQLHGSSGGG